MIFCEVLLAGCNDYLPEVIKLTAWFAQISADCSILGQYRDSSDNICKDCPIGTYQDTKRQDSCKNCPTNYTTQFVKSTNLTDCMSKFKDSRLY